jgi:hypothetical protein
VAISLSSLYNPRHSHSSSLADEHCSSCSMAITSASYLSKSLIETFPKYNRVAVLIHIDKLPCRSWWQPVVSVVETNAALLISNRYFDIFTKFRDSRWRSDHQVLPCRAWVVRNVVDEHICHCAIAGTQKKTNIWMIFLTNNIDVSAWLFSCSAEDVFVSRMRPSWRR